MTAPVRNQRPGRPEAGARTQRPRITVTESRSPAFALDTYRLLAAVALVAMLAASLLVPVAGAAPDPAALAGVGIDGGGSVPSAMTVEDVERNLSRYLTFVERSQGAAGAIPDKVNDILQYDPGSARARKAIIGQIIVSSSGNTNQALVDTGFFSGLNNDKIEAAEFAYQGLANGEQGAAKGIGGQAAISLLRSLNASGDARADLESAALNGFKRAVEMDPITWQFKYNWALAGLFVGDYATAYEAMRSIAADAANDDVFQGVGNKLVPFWMGLAALRAGDPGIAIQRFTEGLNLQAPKDAKEDVVGYFSQARALALEGLGDARWANRDPAAAYKTYYDALSLGTNDDPGLYAKWLRLGLQQHAYEKLLDDMAGLETTQTFEKDPLVHHDRARLLALLGRTAEADSEFGKALSLSENDSAVIVSYGEALESRGDHNGALSQAERAIRALGKDPSSSDLSSVARAAVTTTTSLEDSYAARQLLDAYLLRARAWGKLNQQANVDTLVTGITAQADRSSPGEAGLLQLYGGLAAEAGGSTERARSSYQAAWDNLKTLSPGAPGRAAALAGLARTTGAARSQAEGVRALADNGYDSGALKSEVAKDPDAPVILQQAALLLQQQGKQAEAANALRVAGVVSNLQDARSVTGIGRPLWYYNGASAPANALLAAADASRQAGQTGDGLAALRYRQAFGLDPALAPAWNNLGVMYSQQGRPDLASSYMALAGKVSPAYTWGQHNLAALEYERGWGNFARAESAQGAAIKAAGPRSLQWGYNLRPDERGPLPAPSGPAPSLLSRLPAVLILLLLLAHTLVRRDRQDRAGLVPTRGLIGRIARPFDSAARRAMPWLARPGSDGRALATVIGAPTIVGMVALAWAAGHGSVGVALAFLPAALLVSLLAFGANELVQYLAARRTGAVTAHHLWPTGLLLGVLSIPFSFMYGWQAVTRVQAEPGSPDGAGASRTTRRARTGEDFELAYEAQAEAAAERDEPEVTTRTPAALRPVEPAGRLTGLSPVAGILFAGLAANLALGLLFGLAYWLTGWPSLRLGMFASMLVLAFTSVSEPPADGWTLYRRNAALWLLVFVFAALAVTLLATGTI